MSAGVDLKKQITGGPVQREELTSEMWETEIFVSNGRSWRNTSQREVRAANFQAVKGSRIFSSEEAEYSQVL